jgi:tRNA-splicing ligase RtcB
MPWETGRRVYYLTSNDKFQISNLKIMINKGALLKLTDCLWEVPKTFRSDMEVPARIYATEKMLSEIVEDRSLEQLINVTTLPGIQKYAIVMPDAHEGYGFPIGGVAAFEVANGVISPGGIGYDINCGVRLLRSQKIFSEVQPYLRNLTQAIYSEVPSGVGKGGRLKLDNHRLALVLKSGARKMVEMGYGENLDLPCLESEGVIDEADPSLVSETAKKRGRDQLGTMGAGNHFIEVDRVETIFDQDTASQLQLFKDQIVILIHTGSRGLGHQVATDYIKIMMGAMPYYNIHIPDRELSCVPFNSKQGQDYFVAMSAAANFAWANRQLITWEIRRAWTLVFGEKNEELSILYDVAHNIAKLEEYTIDGKQLLLLVHRKGATRAFSNQPVLIPGSMGTGSYVLMGQKKARDETFSSSAHGAGRRMSRTQAKREVNGSRLKQDLEKEGIVICEGSFSGLAEEAPKAYKNVDEVVDVVNKAGIAKKVVRLKPVAVIKG